MDARNERPKITEIIVVEGKDDTVAIKRAVDADTIETNGSAVDDRVLAKVKLAQERRGVIVFTDPDFPGERIRTIIRQHVPECKHAFLPKSEALAKRKGSVGVEHASPIAIREALKHAHTEKRLKDVLIPLNDLIDAGLIAGVNARKRREQLGELLHIGYANGKQLQKRLQNVSNFKNGIYSSNGESI